jgi:hypothetical protein
MERVLDVKIGEPMLQQAAVPQCGASVKRDHLNDGGSVLFPKTISIHMRE